MLFNATLLTTLKSTATQEGLGCDHLHIIIKLSPKRPSPQNSDVYFIIVLSNSNELETNSHQHLGKWFLSKKKKDELKLHKCTLTFIVFLHGLDGRVGPKEKAFFPHFPRS